MVKNIDSLLGNSKAILALKKIIEKISQSLSAIHIQGPSGTGKELVAHLIHTLGPRSHKPFVPVNCGAIPKELMESEFFGHKKGSFTGATQEKIGFFQAAEGGTLFLDEVGDLPLEMQVKLLRAIQEKAIRPVGAPWEVPVDVRILSATHRNLKSLVQNGQFRDDLFYRINVIEIDIPALKDRKEDLTILIDFFLNKFSQTQKCAKPVLAKESLEILNQYDFPGNIRELENILERGMVLCNDKIIQPKDLNIELNAENSKLNSAFDQTVSMSLFPSFNFSETSLEEYLSCIEKKIIEGTLKQTQGNKTSAAQMLDVSLRTFRYRMLKLGLE